MNRPTTPIDELRREHANMRSVWALLARQLDMLEQAGSADFVLMANSLYYMRKFPGTLHHPKEDLIFRRLAELEPSWKAQVEALLSQHREIYALEDELIEVVLDQPRPGSEAVVKLAELGRRYLQLQREHSEIEEHLLFPQALQTLDAQDWRDINAGTDKLEDPLFGQHSGGRYRLLYEHLMQEADDR